MKKYKLIIEKSLGKSPEGNKYFRIQALRDFSNVSKGDFGGIVEGEHNLDQSGNSWIDYDAEVTGNARLEDNALVAEFASVSGDVVIKDDVRITGYASIACGGVISGDTIIHTLNMHPKFGASGPVAIRA